MEKTDSLNGLACGGRMTDKKVEEIIRALQQIFDTPERQGLFLYFPCPNICQIVGYNNDRYAWTKEPICSLPIGEN